MHVADYSFKQSGNLESLSCAPNVHTAALSNFNEFVPMELLRTLRRALKGDRLSFHRILFSSRT